MRTERTTLKLSTAAAGLLLALSGCFQPKTITCENGNFCPAGLRCVASDRVEFTGKICISENCGDGTIQRDLGEECDDGKETASCTFDCKISSCGDGHKNPVALEECDDGKETSSCTAQCKISSCGDGYTNREAGEQCDDAQETATCTVKCRFSSCGDGYPNEAAGEKCDPGAAGETENCNRDCTSAACGDGVVNRTKGEVCDPGAAGETLDCDSDCTSASCGDGKTNRVRGETCDPGAALETLDCNSDCTNATCGDGKVNRTKGEVCDPGASGETTDCDSDCTTANCGDGKVNSTRGETCDPGAAGETTTCNANCTTTVCGDGYVNKVKGEQCDPGAAGETVDCNSDCSIARCGDAKVNATRNEICDPGAAGETANCNANCTPASCGDGFVNKTRGEQCDPGAAGETVDCNSDCSIARCGDGKVNLTRLEQCDPGAAGETATCNTDCSSAVCGDRKVNKARGEECDEGGETATCNGAGAGTVACKFSKCHDGFTNATANEVCDPGAAFDTTGCNNDCTPASCHDGKVNQARGETCDPGGNALTETPTCNANCSTSRCGDGVYNKSANEQCDLGDGVNGQPGSSCTAICTSAACGDGSVNPAVGEECDPGPAGETDKCNSNCTIAKCSDGIVNVTAHEGCDPGWPVTVPPHDPPARTETAACNADCSVYACGDGKVNRTAGEECDDLRCADGTTACTVATEAVDCAGIGVAGSTLGKCVHSGSGNCNPTGATVAGSSPTVNIGCRFSRCGDGFVNSPFEECDPGAAGETASCNSDCTLARCGDGQVNRTRGEQCDDGEDGSSKCNGANAKVGAPADLECKVSRCGDAWQNPRAIAPACDNTAATCLVEECDAGASGSSACTIYCKGSTCGDGIVNALAGEQCDAGANGSATCNGPAAPTVGGKDLRCQFSRCGDGWQNPRATSANCSGGVCQPEACDAGPAGSAACTVLCTVSACGDGVVNTLAVPPEQCDDGPSGSKNCNGAGSVFEYPTGTFVDVSCKISRCGDGFVNPRGTNPEVCDPGPALLETAACNSDCTQTDCGDSKVNRTAGEQCDDGAGGSAACNGDAAPTVGGKDLRCQVSRCGDGWQNTASTEACDPGLTGESSACNRDCTVASCGDAKINVTRGEQCDELRCANGTTACTVATEASDCAGIGSGLTLGKCLSGSTTCNPDSAGAALRCRPSLCGDTYTNAYTEQCDPGATGETSACNRDCTNASCGDSKVNTTRGEQCDVGASGSATCNGSNAATGVPVALECKLSRCGDTWINPASTEQCDPGAAGETTACNRDCTNASCGDNKINATRGEECDDRRCENGTTACTLATAATDCAGIGTAQCLSGSATCNPNGAGTAGALSCKSSRCGDSYRNLLDPAEQCDAGPAGSAACTSTCKDSSCGDGVINPAAAEQCDELRCADGTTPCTVATEATDCAGIGSGGTLGKCLAGSAFCNGPGAPEALRCKISRCGDGWPNPKAVGPVCDDTSATCIVEQCDDGNVSNTDACPNTCKNAFCGDNYVQSGTENCDEGSNNGTSCPYGLVCNICRANCSGYDRVGGAFCGDGTPQAGENCDDRNNLGCGTCSADCQTPTPEAKAIGWVKVPNKSALGGTTDLVLDDGLNGPVTFVLVKDAATTVTAPKIKVLATATADEDIALSLRDTINQNFSRVRIVASTAAGATDGLVSLEHAYYGKFGNKAITCTDSDVTLSDATGASTTTTGTMRGGKAHGCGTGVGCTSTADCSPGTACVGTSCTDTFYALTITPPATYLGTVTADYGLINCGSVCSDNLPAQQVVRLTAAVSGGAAFANWGTDACASATGNTCTLTMDAAKTVSPVFSATSYRLSVEVVTAGTGSVTEGANINCPGTCEHTYSYTAPGTAITLTATDGASDKFSNWSGACTGSSPTCGLTMSSDKGVTANFLPAFAATAAVTGDGGGSVSDDQAPKQINNCGAAGSCSGFYFAGTTVTLTATPDATSVFTGWSGACTNATGPCVLTAGGTATAHFAANKLTLTLAGTGSVSVSDGAGFTCAAGSCSQTYTVPTGVTLDATRDDPNTTILWAGCTTSSGNTCNVTMDGPKAVSVTVDKITYTVAVTTNNTNGTVASSPAGITGCNSGGGTCSAPFDSGTTVRLTATPGPSKNFLGWTGGTCEASAGTTPECDVSVTAARSETATFD